MKVNQDSQKTDHMANRCLRSDCNHTSMSTLQHTTDVFNFTLYGQSVLRQMRVWMEGQSKEKKKDGNLKIFHTSADMAHACVCVCNRFTLGSL